MGYAEIAEATGIDKRQLQRLMTRGKFPKPDALPTKENRRRPSVVPGWLEQRNAEQIGEAIQTLGARLAAQYCDQVAPEDTAGVARWGVRRT